MSENSDERIGSKGGGAIVDCQLVMDSDYSSQEIDNCVIKVYDRYDTLYNIEMEEFCKEFEPGIRIWPFLVYQYCKLGQFDKAKGLLCEVNKLCVKSTLTVGNVFLNGNNIGQENLPTGDRIEELQQNVGMMFERMWEHWESKPITENSLVDIGDKESALKFLLHNLEQLIHCCNRKASEPKDLVLASKSYTIQPQMVEPIILTLSALPLLLLLQKSLSSLDVLLYDILFERFYNLLSTEMTQRQAGIRLLVVNLVLGLFTWLNGHLRVDLDSSVQDSLVLKCMKAITHYCSHIIVGIQVRSQLHFLQIAGFQFNGDKHWNVLQGFMEFEIMILGNETTIELTVRQDAVVKNHQRYLPTLSSVQYQIV